MADRKKRLRMLMIGKRSSFIEAAFYGPLPYRATITEAKRYHSSPLSTDRVPSCIVLPFFHPHASEWDSKKTDPYPQNGKYNF